MWGPEILPKPFRRASGAVASRAAASRRHPPAESSLALRAAASFAARLRSSNGALSRSARNRWCRAASVSRSVDGVAGAPRRLSSIEGALGGASVRSSRSVPPKPKKASMSGGPHPGPELASFLRSSTSNGSLIILPGSPVRCEPRRRASRVCKKWGRGKSRARVLAAGQPLPTLEAQMIEL